jgi:Transglycosylase SLT domain
MPRVAAEQGLHDPFDPIPALHTSGKVLSQLRARFGNLGLAAAAYNAGPRRVQDWMTRRGKLPAETRQYVRTITGRPAEHWARRAVNVLEHRLPLFARCAEAKTALANASAREAATARPKTTLAARAAASVKMRVVRPAVEIRRAEAPKRERVASR